MESDRVSLVEGDGVSLVEGGGVTSMEGVVRGGVGAGPQMPSRSLVPSLHTHEPFLQTVLGYRQWASSAQPSRGRQAPPTSSKPVWHWQRPPRQAEKSVQSSSIQAPSCMGLVARGQPPSTSWPVLLSQWSELPEDRRQLKSRQEVLAAPVQGCTSYCSFEQFKTVSSNALRRYCVRNVKGSVSWHSRWQSDQFDQPDSKQSGSLGQLSKQGPAALRSSSPPTFSPRSTASEQRARGR